MQFSNKGIVKCVSSDETRYVLTTVRLRYAEQENKSGIKGAFLEATDGRILVRYSVVLDPEDVCVRDDNLNIPIPVDVIKAAVSICRKKTPPFYIKIEEKAFVMADGRTFPRKDDTWGTWPNTDQIIPDSREFDRTIAINPQYMAKCADAIGLDDNQPVSMQSDLDDCTPWMMKSSEGMAIIMPGRYPNVIALGITSSTKRGQQEIKAAEEYMKALRVGYNDGRDPESNGIQKSTVDIEAQSRAWSSGYIDGFNQGAEDKALVPA
jgi:hypothetical protein